MASSTYLAERINNSATPEGRWFSVRHERGVALGFIGHVDLPAAVAHRLGLALHDVVDFALVEHGAGVALVAQLGPAFALADAARRTTAAARAIRGRRLGRVVRIEVDALLQGRHLRVQFAQQQRLRTEQLCLRLSKGVAPAKRVRQLSLL